jgi:hypothetical protein
VTGFKWMAVFSLVLCMWVMARITLTPHTSPSVAAWFGFAMGFCVLLNICSLRR